MGADALESNGITKKVLYFFRDKALTPADEPLRRVRKSRILLFVAIQLAGFGATMAVTQTIGRILRSHPECCGTFLIGVPCSCYRVPCYHHTACTGANLGDSPAAFYGCGALYLGWSDCLCLRKSAEPVRVADDAEMCLSRLWRPSVAHVTNTSDEWFMLQASSCGVRKSSSS